MLDAYPIIAYFADNVELFMRTYTDHNRKPATTGNDHSHVQHLRHERQNDFKGYKQYISQNSCVSGRLAEDLTSEHDCRDDQAPEFYEENTSTALSLRKHRLPCRNQ